MSDPPKPAMDLTLLSPEVQAVIASGNIDRMCDMAARLRGRDGFAYRVLSDVIESFRAWTDFAASKGPEGIEEGAGIMVRMAQERHGLVLPMDRAKELIRLVYLFEHSFGFDPDEFFLWLLDQTVKAAGGSRGTHA